MNTLYVGIYYKISYFIFAWKMSKIWLVYKTFSYLFSFLVSHFKYLNKALEIQIQIHLCIVFHFFFLQTFIHYMQSYKNELSYMEISSGFPYFHTTDFLCAPFKCLNSRMQINIPSIYTFSRSFPTNTLNCCINFSYTRA